MPFFFICLFTFTDCIFTFNYVCMCMGVCVPGTVMPVAARRGRRIPEPGVKGSYQLPGVGAGNSARVLCKNSKHSTLLSHLSWPCSFLYRLGPGKELLFPFILSDPLRVRWGRGIWYKVIFIFSPTYISQAWCGKLFNLKKIKWRYFFKTCTDFKFESQWHTIWIQLSKLWFKGERAEGSWDSPGHCRIQNLPRTPPNYLSFWLFPSRFKNQRLDETN